MTRWETLSDPERARIRRWQWVILSIAVLGELFMAADVYGFAAIIPFISASLHLTATETGFAQGIISVSYCVGMFLWSPQSQKISGRRLFLVSLLAIGAGMMGQVLAPTLAWLVAARLVIGFAEATAWLGIMKLLVGWYPPERRGWATALVLAAYSLAITLDFAVGIPVAASWGWRAFFGGIGVLTLATGVFGGVFGKAGPAEIGIAGFAWGEPPPPKPLPVMLLFRSKWLYFGGLGIFGDTFALAATATWVVPAFAQMQGMPLEEGALIGTVMGLSQILFLLIGGYWSDRMSRAALVQIGALFGAVSAACFAAATLWAMPFWLLLGISGLSGVAVLSGGAIFSLLSDKFPDALVPAAVGYTQMFSLASTFAAPAFMGVAIDLSGSFVVAFLAFAGAELLVLVLLVALGRERAGVARLKPA